MSHIFKFGKTLFTQEIMSSWAWPWADALGPDDPQTCNSPWAWLYPTLNNAEDYPIVWNIEALRFILWWIAMFKLTNWHGFEPSVLLDHPEFSKTSGRQFVSYKQKCDNSLILLKNNGRIVNLSIKAWFWSHMVKWLYFW